VLSVMVAVAPHIGTGALPRHQAVTAEPEALLIGQATSPDVPPPR
jgi:hypothetical protein